MSLKRQMFWAGHWVRSETQRTINFGQAADGSHGWRVRIFSNRSISPRFFGSQFPRMKTTGIIIVVLVLCIVRLPADPTATATATSAGMVQGTPLPDATPFQVMERGADHRVWQRSTFEKLPNGKVVTHVHKYTELAAGLHYKNAQGRWVESKEEIDVLPQGGAVGL